VTEHAAHLPTVADLLWPVLNFIIFAALLVRFLRGPVIEFFRERTERLRTGLQAGARARAEAEALRTALARDVADLPALRERLRSDLRAAAELQRDAILRQARQAADRIRADARQLAEQEFNAAKHALRLEVVDETVRQAMAILREALGPADRDRLVRDFIERAGSAT
jgi:F-type H+-transporting ATPase subunit b